MSPFPAAHQAPKSGGAKVMIPTNNIQPHTVYITTLGTDGASCTRKPERLLPERARLALPPMVGSYSVEGRENVVNRVNVSAMFCFFGEKYSTS